MRLTKKPRGGQLEERRELSGRTLHPAPDLIHGEEGPGLHLTGSEPEGTVVPSDQKLHELMARLRGGFCLPELHEGTVGADFFPHLPMPCLLVGFPGIDMAGRAGAPEIGVVDLPRGSLLKEKLSSGVENPEMNRPVEKVIHMDLAPEP